MDSVYYISDVLMVLLFLGLVTLTIVLLIKPHLLNQRKHVKKPFSRSKIVVIGLAAVVLNFTIFGSVMAATEPASVKQARIAQEAEDAAQKVKQAQAAAQAKADQAKAAADAEAAKPVTKTETTTAVVPFETTQQETSALPKGQTTVTTAGVNGERTLTYHVTYVRGKETVRTQVSDEITTKPVAQVTQVGTYVAPAPQPTTPAASRGSGSTTSAQSSVRTGAMCKDGSSSSATGSGACSHHHGVAYWLYR